MSALPRFAFVSSSAGSIMDQVLRNPTLRPLVHGLACDRVCGAIDRARAHDLPVVVLTEPDPERFGVRLLEYLRERDIDYVFSFYTQFLGAAVREAYRDRILNFHPSLLPAFPGMDGFRDATRHGVKILGSTVELIDQVMDEGKIVMQTVVPVDPMLSEAELRHRLFVQQCKSLLQTARWLIDERLHVDGRRVTIEGAHFREGEYSPGLDWADAERLAIPFPGAATLAALGVS
jgi:phosphoribosylglycinamide formyltransferase 1